MLSCHVRNSVYLDGGVMVGCHCMRLHRKAVLQLLHWLGSKASRDAALLPAELGQA
jgi:hypothetical protein